MCAAIMLKAGLAFPDRIAAPIFARRTSQRMIHSRPIAQSTSKRLTRSKTVTQSVLVALTFLALIGSPCPAISQESEDRSENRVVVTNDDDGNSDAKPTLTPEQIDDVIARLSARSFREREAAMAEILSIGTPAIPRLRKLEDSDDIELRKRIETVTQRLMNDDFESRAEAFLEGEPGVTLPGWEYFKSKIGARVRHREVFIELCRRHPGAVMLLDGTDDDRKEAFDLVLESFGPVIRDPNFADAVALLLLSSDDALESSEKADRIIRFQFNYFEVRNLALEPEFKDSIRNLLNKWITKVSDQSWMYAVLMAGQWNLEATPKLAEKILGKSKEPDIVLLTFQVLARLGEAKDALIVERFLEDKLVLDQGYFYTDAAGRRLQVKMCDVAMATIATLNDRDLKDLGFPAARTTGDGFFEIESVGFPVGDSGEEARNRVLEDVKKILEELKKED